MQFIWPKSKTYLKKCCVNWNNFCLQNHFLLQTEFPNDVDIDLDEILDIEDEKQRKKFIRVSRTKNLSLHRIYLKSFYQDILNNSKSSKEIINVSEQKHLYLLHSSQSSRFYICQFSEIHRWLVGASQDSVIYSCLCHQTLLWREERREQQSMEEFSTVKIATFQSPTCQYHE